jgi:hypothetical protein
VYVGEDNREEFDIIFARLDPVRWSRRAGVRETGDNVIVGKILVHKILDFVREHNAHVTVTTREGEENDQHLNRLDNGSKSTTFPGHFTTLNSPGSVRLSRSGCRAEKEGQ